MFSDLVGSTALSPTVVSGSPEDDLVNFRAIMQAERMRSHRLTVPGE